jgi:quercetin dioxygenase-like cupin family protein
MTNTITNIPLSFRGSMATIRLSHDGEADRIAVIKHRLPQTYAPPLHAHLNQDQVFHVLRGRICVEVDGTMQHAGPGDLLKAPKGIPHRFIVPSEGDAVVLPITSGPTSRVARAMSGNHLSVARRRRCCARPKTTSRASRPLQTAMALNSSAHR